MTAFLRNVELLSVRKKINVEFSAILGGLQLGLKAKIRIFLKPLFNALNMLSAVRLTLHLTCLAFSD